MYDIGSPRTAGHSSRMLFGFREGEYYPSDIIIKITLNDHNSSDSVENNLLFFIKCYLILSADRTFLCILLYCYRISRKSTLYK